MGNLRFMGFSQSSPVFIMVFFWEIKKKSKMNIFLQKRIFSLLFLSLLTVSGFWISCEVSRSVSFDFPDYEPTLIIDGAASPQSGRSEEHTSELQSHSQ